MPRRCGGGDVQRLTARLLPKASGRGAVCVSGIGPALPCDADLSDVAPGDLDGIDSAAETIGACYGDALIAAIAAGLVAEQTNWARPAETLTPNRDSEPLYAELFELYSALYPQTATAAHRLAQLSTSSDE